MTCSVWPTTYAAKPPSPAGGDRRAAQLREACCGFAALLWEEVLKASGDGLFPGGVTGGEVFRGLARQALAMELARSGGLSDFLYRAMAGSSQLPGCEKDGT